MLYINGSGRNNRSLQANLKLAIELGQPTHSASHNNQDRYVNRKMRKKKSKRKLQLWTVYSQ